MVREGRVLYNPAGKPAWGANYLITAYPVGAQVSAGSSGDTIQVHAGHGFAASDKGIVFEEGSAARYFQVGSVTSLELTLAGGQTLSVAAGEYLVNLGPDTGFTEPNYDQSQAVIYTDMDYTTVATNSTVQATDTGRYIYFHQGIARWELIRSDATTPLALYLDAGGGGDFLPLDLDSDGTNELAHYAAPFSSNRYWIYHRETIEADVTTDAVQAGILQTFTWSGDSTVANRNAIGIFAINQFGVSGSGGANLSGPAISIGGYAEHRGTGSWAAGAFMGAELAATLYGDVAMAGAVFGALCIASVDNATLGGPAVCSSEFIGVRGLARVYTGSATLPTVIGVDGVVSHFGTGTMTAAYGGRFQFSTVTGGGVITTAYGVRIEAIVAGTTNNYGLYIGGASGAATINEALYVATGKTTFADTTAFTIFKTNNVYFGDATDRDLNLHFDTSTSDGAITYKGGSATNVFEFNKPFRQVTSNTAIFSVSQISESITLNTGGTTTDSSTNLLPAGAFILGVVARVTTTIATATDWALGDATTALRFCTAQSGAQLTAGATVIGMAHLSGAISTLATGPSQASAAALRITTTGTPSAGVIRVTVNYLSFTAPTS